MKRAIVLPIIVTVLALVLVPIASAHSPMSGSNNESLATATVVHDPTKSWAIYADLHQGGEAQYYRFDIPANETIYVQLFVSTAPEDAGFTPGFVVVGPGLTDNGTVPTYVERPNGSGAVVVPGTWPARATYEAFAPSSFNDLGSLRLPAPAAGTYYVAVFEPDRGGHYGLAIGERESFTLEEWVLLPVNVLSVFSWERRNLALVLAPAIATVALGLAYLWWQRREMALPPRSWLAATASLLFLGSAAGVFEQMAISMGRAPAGGEAGITLMFALIPLVLGIATLRFALKGPATWSRRRRIELVVLGVLALFLWSGYLVGPILAVVAGVLPNAAPHTSPAAEA